MIVDNTSLVSVADFKRVFDEQRKNSHKIALTDAKERIEKLKRMQAYIMSHLGEIEKVMYKDFRKPPVEVQVAEVYSVTSEIKFACNNLKRWMKPQRVPTPIGLIGTYNYIKHEPKGNVLIISPWNYPFSLAIKPLVAAVAAGNVVMLKPSELTPHTSGFIKDMIEELFPQNEVAVFEGEVEVATELLKLPFNHIFFTGMPTVGKVVMRAAAEHLASVTLELGGKSPNIIDETADVKKAAYATAWSKCFNNGQTCIAVDYVMIHSSQKEAFISAYRDAIQQMLNPESKGIEQSESYARIVNRRHFRRIKSYIDDALEKGAEIELGGKMVEVENFIEPTVLTGVHDDMQIMQEEIFGPVLPIITYQYKEEVVAYINGKEKPLALYIQSKNPQNIDYFLNNTRAGDSVINDLMLQFSHPELPFGGVNNSGIGKANGFFGFKEMSNLRGVSKRQFGAMKFLYPPYHGKVKRLVDLIVKYF